MKIRTGFVSNSSSSSFLIAGTKIPYSEMALYFGDDWYDKDIDCHGDDNFYYIGETIFHISEGYGVENVSMEDLLKKYEVAKEKLKNLKIDKPVEIFAGTIYG